MRALLWLTAPALLAAPSILLQPPCGTTRVRVTWNSEERAPVRVVANGVAMTGDELASGTADTGDWVTPGMEFRLIDDAGNVLATARAGGPCGSIWPLQIGNQWTYRTRDRIQTGEHTTVRVARAEVAGGVEWFVLEPPFLWARRVRVDGEGRIVRLDNDENEQIFLDPSRGPALASVGIAAPPPGPLSGLFGESLHWNFAAGLGSHSGTFARGFGPVATTTNMLTGSSGGFLTGYELLEATIDGVRYGPAYPSVELVAETSVADITGKKVRNCALPCYFVACGLGPGAVDPPDAYKPCMEVSLRGGAGKVQLLDAAGTVLFEKPANGWVSVPLYKAPASPLPPGHYTVVGTVGAATASSKLEVR